MGLLLAANLLATGLQLISGLMLDRFSAICQAWFCNPCLQSLQSDRTTVISIRIALAWSPGRSPQTVIRAGFGIYHEDGQLDDQNLPISNEVYAYTLSNKTIPTLSYPITPFLADTNGIISPRDDDRQRKDTR
jgi:hypothetical protein